jgi:glyoxylase-like metal-dependent hydrolase (beta-lactamase superfamily II)
MLRFLEVNKMAKVIFSKNCFSFWSIGQGLFYTGELNFRFFSKEKWKTFNFLYDIGSKKGKNRLKTIVKTNFKGKIFDLLFISHFHEDHVNGLKDLKKNGVRIRKMVVPYVDPVEWLLLLASTRNPSKWYTSFIADPYKWILVNLNVEKLYVWKGGNGKLLGDDGKNHS